MKLNKQTNELAVRTKKRKVTKNEWQLYSMCLIPILLVFIFSYLPMGGIIIAFKNYKYNLGIFGSEWTGMENFKFFVTSDSFLKITWNTLSMNAIFIVTGLVMAVTVAILLYYVHSRRATKVFQTVLITPNFQSWVVASYMVYAFLNPNYGLINTFLGIFGKEPVDWYAKPNAWPMILTICNIWKHVGMDSVLYYAALMGLDSSLFEAAEVDGANRWQVVKAIIIPLLVPLITLKTILAIGGIFSADFGLFYQVTRNVGLLYDKTDVINTYIFRTMREVGDMGMSSAAGLLQSLVGMALVLLTNFVVRKTNPENSLF